MPIIADTDVFNTCVKEYPNLNYTEIAHFKNVMKKNKGGGVRGMSRMDDLVKAMYQRQADQRAKTRVRELILANNLKYLWTLTYSDEVEERSTMTRDYNKFTQKMRYHNGGSFDYVGTIEVQKRRAKKYGKNVLHAHFATNKRYKHGQVSSLWGQGYVYVSEYSGNIFDVAKYISKYVGKEMGSKYEVREKEQKRYFRSKGLVTPIRKTVLLDERDRDRLQADADVIKKYDDGSVWMAFNGTGILIQEKDGDRWESLNVV